jgi:hypothetical protein
MKLIRALMILSVIAIALALALFFLRFTCLAVTVTAVGSYYAMKRWRPEPTAHGSAAWCSEDEARKAGLL